MGRHFWRSGLDSSTTSNAVASAVHDRMPVILDPDSYDLWLAPGMTNVAAAAELLKPFDARLMRCHPVGARINHVANDDEGCSAPVELVQFQIGYSRSATQRDPDVRGRRGGMSGRLACFKVEVISLAT